MNQNEKVTPYVRLCCSFGNGLNSNVLHWAACHGFL